MAIKHNQVVHMTTPTGFSFTKEIPEEGLPEYVTMITSAKYNTRLIIEKIEHSPTCACLKGK